MEKRQSVIRIAKSNREAAVESSQLKTEMEKKFLAFAGGKRTVEYRSVRYLLKSNRLLSQALIALCDLSLTPEKERELSALYKISDKDAVDFDKFFELGQILAREAESHNSEDEDMDYGLSRS